MFRTKLYMTLNNLNLTTQTLSNRHPYLNLFYLWTSVILIIVLIQYFLKLTESNAIGKFKSFTVRHGDIQVCIDFGLLESVRDHVIQQSCKKRLFLSKINTFV